MATNVNLTYAPAADGGVTLQIDIPQGRIVLPMDHETALRQAALMLHNAGVTRAEFEHGQLHAFAREP